MGRHVNSKERPLEGQGIGGFKLRTQEDYRLSISPYTENYPGIMNFL